MFLNQDTHQGLRATSCWARGQAWGVYGFAECYRCDGRSRLPQCRRRLVDYHAAPRIPPDLVPFLGLRQPADPQ